MIRSNIRLSYVVAVYCSQPCMLTAYLVEDASSDSERLGTSLFTIENYKIRADDTPFINSDLLHSFQIYGSFRGHRTMCISRYRHGVSFTFITTKALIQQQICYGMICYALWFYTNVITRPCAFLQGAPNQGIAPHPTPAIFSDIQLTPRRSTSMQPFGKN